MAYLIGQIAIFLLLAALLGLAVGWLMRGLVEERQRKANSEPEPVEAETQADPFEQPTWPS